MAVTKVTKTVMLSIEKMQKVDAVAKNGDMKFSAALEVIVEYGIKEYERRMGSLPVVPA